MRATEWFATQSFHDERFDNCPACGHAWGRHGWTHASIAGPPEPTCKACKGGCDEHARQAAQDREARA